MNFFEGTVEAGGVRVPGLGDQVVATKVKLPGAGSKVILGLRPNHILIDPDAATHHVDLTESLGGVSYVYLNAKNGDRIIVEAREDQPVPHGSEVGVTFDAAHAMVFDAKTEARLR